MSSIATETPCIEHGRAIEELKEDVLKLRLRVAYMTGAAAVGGGVGGFLGALLIYFISR